MFDHMGIICSTALATPFIVANLAIEEFLSGGKYYTGKGFNRLHDEVFRERDSDLPDAIPKQVKQRLLLR